MEPSYKLLKEEIWSTSGLVNSLRFWEGDMPREGMKVFLILWVSSIWLLLSCILNNKPILLSKVFT